MINKTQKRKLKKHLNNDYVADVLAILDSKNIVTRNKTPFSESAIRMVFNGVRENLDIETAILELYANRKKDHEVREANKNKLLSA